MTKLGFSLWVALGVGLGSCTYLIDASVVQCETSADCTSRGEAFAHTICSTRRVCVKGPDCTRNADCADAHPGEPSVCRKPDQTCVQLTSAECVVRAEPADLTNDQTLWLGLVSPRMTGPHMEAAANLVRQQIVKSGNLPPAALNGLRRPLAFVSCTNDGGALPRAMDQLVNVLRLPAILGSNLSGDIVTMLTNYTTREGVLTISPTASAPNISDIPNNGLFFRTAGTDTIAVKTLAQVLKQVVEPRLRTGPPAVLGPDEPMKVAVMYRGDALGISSVNIANTAVSFNGKSAAENGARYKTINYGDPADPSNTTPTARYATAVADVIAFAPHVIFVFGSLEFSNMDREIERLWPPGAPYRPFYLVVKGLAKVFGDDIGADEGWARRVLGAQPYFDKSTPSYRAYEQFYKDTYPQLAASVGLAATPAYFDATYVMAYAVVANGNRPVTGANLADAVRTRLTPPGRRIFVGYDRIFEVLTALGNGERVDVQGITGTLDFLPNGDVPQTQEVFCMKTEPGPGMSFGKVVGAKNSGMVFDADRDAIVGMIGNCPGP
jgi:ABC-type branched-subunit amino acid transport system substrate-binding protein